MASVCKSCVAFVLVAAVAAERAQENLLLQLSHYTGGQLSSAGRRAEAQGALARASGCRAAAGRPSLSDSDCEAACELLPDGMWPCDESGVCTCMEEPTSTMTPSGGCKAGSGLESVVADDDCATACSLLPAGAWPCDNTGVCTCGM
eukprot:TRINITY_DN432_c0_g1_i4.p2 TRINITY_DN432_c0_g1~~TRINITY_DN432_c0_g1_i4.p2  ORF type:complete len:147 (+),score=22.30 TRINITY_DN432_c0_g1_i4:112-552(+)